MNLEINKAMAASTPSSCLGDYVAEHVAALMTLGAIEGISIQKHQSGMGSRLHVSITQFEAPNSVKMTGIIIKDALAQIMSVANIARILMTPEEEEMESMRKTWKESSEDAEAANGGSGQDFSNERNAQ